MEPFKYPNWLNPDTYSTFISTPDTGDRGSRHVIVSFQLSEPERTLSNWDAAWELDGVPRWLHWSRWYYLQKETDRAGVRFSQQASNFALINKVRGGVGSSPHDIFPIWIFFQASEAVNIQESMIPATVNAPPIMAQICTKQTTQSASPSEVFSSG